MDRARCPGRLTHPRSTQTELSCLPPCVFGDYVRVQRLCLALTLIISIVPVACSASDDSGLAVSATGGAGGSVSPPASGGQTFATGGVAPASGGVPIATGGTPQASGGAAPRDPSAFDWPESSPDGGSTRLCKPGRYVGTYKCTITGPPGAPAVALELTGPVDLRLAQAQ